MMLLNLPILATILLLVPRFYLLLASPAFLLVSPDIPQVAYIFRSVFMGYFFVLVAVGVVATTLYAWDARPILVVVGMTLLTVFDVIWRRNMMKRIDALQTKIALGFTGFGSQLRRLHYFGMGINAVETASLLVLIPYLVVTP
jgi:hypothetical protein